MNIHSNLISLSFISLALFAMFSDPDGNNEISMYKFPRPQKAPVDEARKVDTTPDSDREERIKLILDSYLKKADDPDYRHPWETITPNPKLRGGIKVTEKTLWIAKKMYSQGWRYKMPSPKSRLAMWGEYDGRTTWWEGYWYTAGTQSRSFSHTTPKLKDGRYVGDGKRKSWRKGGSPHGTTNLQWLLSESGGIKPEQGLFQKAVILWESN